MTNVVFIHADNPTELNSAVWRCIKPAYALNEAGHEAVVLDYIAVDPDRKKGLEKILSYDPQVVFFQRYCWNSAIWIAEELQKRGIIVVYDFDDDYEEILPSNMGYAFWYEGMAYNPDGSKKPIQPPLPVKSWEWFRDIADIVTTPSVFLNHKYGGRLLENMPLRKWWRKSPKPRKSKTKTIGWGGGATHVESWTDSGIIKPLLQAALENKWNIRIVGASNVMQAIGLEKNKMKRVPMCVFRPYMKSEQWPGDLRTQFDLYVIPLTNHDFDKARSPIKVIECGLAGLPWIATDNSVYQDFQQFGTLIPNSEEHWYNAIVHSMNKNAAQKQAALSTRNYILNHYMIEDNVAHILEVFTP